MPEPPVDPISDRPLDELVQTASEQAVVVARQQVDLARRELTAKARQAGAGAAMVGGGAFLGVLASGTGTAALVLLLARRPAASAAALGVTGVYASAGALLAREGLERIREAGPLVPEEAVQNAKKNLGSAKRGGKSAVKPSAASRRSTSSARRPPREQQARPRRRASEQ